MSADAVATSSARSVSWRTAVRVALFAVAFRVFSAVLAFFCNIVFPLDQPEQYPSVFGPLRSLWDPFTRYDSGHFYQIARFGYAAGPNAYVAGGRSSIAYFPVYPLLMRYVGRLFGPRPSDLFIGGIVVSWVAFVLAIVLLLHVAERDVDAEEAERQPRAEEQHREVRQPR